MVLWSIGFFVGKYWEYFGFARFSKLGKIMGPSMRLGGLTDSVRSIDGRVIETFE